jgi:hypothetical protein
MEIIEDGQNTETATAKSAMARDTRIVLIVIQRWIMMMLFGTKREVNLSVMDAMKMEVK